MSVRGQAGGGLVALLLLATVGVQAAQAASARQATPPIGLWRAFPLDARHPTATGPVAPRGTVPPSRSAPRTVAPARPAPGADGGGSGGWWRWAALALALAALSAAGLWFARRTARRRGARAHATDFGPTPTGRVPDPTGGTPPVVTTPPELPPAAAPIDEPAPREFMEAVRRPTGHTSPTPARAARRTATPPAGAPAASLSSPPRATERVRTERCQIKWQPDPDLSSFYAEAEDAPGVVLARSPTFRWRSANPPPRRQTIVQAHAALCARLAEAGWEPAEDSPGPGERPGRWYQRHLSRRMPA